VQVAEALLRELGLPDMPTLSHQASALDGGDAAKASVRGAFLQKSQGRPGQCYEPVQKLGEGAFGVAHLVRDRRSAVLRVLKTINKRQSQVPAGQLEKEISNMKACDHPHIVRLFEYYEDYENIYLIMEHAEGGELHQVLEEQKRKNLNLPERWVSVAIKQCLMAIAYVHSQGIIHKDLKSENILLLQKVDVNDPQSQPHAVIIDLGIAELFSARLGRRARCTVVAGTPTHMAPEVWRGNFGPVADVWSLGVVMFELLAGEIPFLCSSLNSAQEWLRMHRQGPNWSLLSHCSSQALAINKRMLNWDERMRPTAQQCLGHSWFKEPGVAEAGVAEEAPSVEEAPAPPPEVEDPNSAAAAAPPLTARQPPSEAVVQALGDYMGRSKFEKAVLLQVASQLHLAQMGRLYEVFTAADSNKDGTVSKDEFKAALLHLGVEPGDAESYVACVDVDANGRVEYTELACGCIGLLYESLRSLLWQSFCVLDVDGNGVLSRDEVQAVVMRVELVQHGFPGNEPASSVAEAISRMDVDHNGQISFDELCKVFIPKPVINSGQEAVGGAGGGAGQTPASNRQTRAMRDEEFAQLLDEIEAGDGGDDAGASLGCGAAAGGSGVGLPPPQTWAGGGGCDIGGDAAGGGSLVAPGAPGAQTVPGAIPGPAAAAGIGGGGSLGGLCGTLTSLDLTKELAAVGADGSCLLAQAPDGGVANAGTDPDTKGDGVQMTVDEELSHLLADIANGP